MQEFGLPPDESGAKISRTVNEVVEPELPVSAELFVTRGKTSGKLFRLTRPIVCIGRSGKGHRNQIEFDDGTVSRAQAKILYDWEKRSFFLNNDSQRNPTLVNGKEAHAVYLMDGDTITMGEVELLFRMRGKTASPIIDEPLNEPYGFSDETVILAPIQGELRVTMGKDVGKVFMITRMETILGRGSHHKSNYMVFCDNSVSKNQAKILYSANEGAFQIINISEINPTRVNRKMVPFARLWDGDEISFGTIVMTFSQEKPRKKKPM